MPECRINESKAYEYKRLFLIVKKMKEAKAEDDKKYQIELNNHQHLDVQLNEFLHYMDDYSRGISIPWFLVVLFCISFVILYRLVPLLESSPDWLVFVFSLFVVLVVGAFQVQTSKSVRLISLMPTITMADGDEKRAKFTFWASSGAMLASACAASFFIEYFEVNSLSKLRLSNLAPVLSVVMLSAFWMFVISTDARNKISDVSSAVLDKLESQGLDVQTEVRKLKRECSLSLGRLQDIATVQSMRGDWLAESHKKLSQYRAELFFQN